MNILLTGGSGFIGYHLANKLRLKGNEVFIVDRKDGIEIGSMKMHKLLRSVEIDMIYHFAANSDISNSDPSVELRDTLFSTITMLNVCRNYNIKRFAFASSSAIYGEAKGAISENYGPLNPISNYGAAKLSSEAFIYSYSHNYGIQAWIFRFPNVVGSHATHGVVLDLLRKHKQTPECLEVLGTGDQCKPYIHVSELVDAIYHIYNNLKEWVNVVNIAPIGLITVKEIAELITNGKIVYTGGKAWDSDVERYEYDTAKLRRSNWHPKMTSTEAVKLAIEEIKLEI